MNNFKHFLKISNRLMNNYNFYMNLFSQVFFPCTEFATSFYLYRASRFNYLNTYRNNNIQLRTRSENNKKEEKTSIYNRFHSNSRQQQQFLRQRTNVLTCVCVWNILHGCEYVCVYNTSDV